MKKNEIWRSLLGYCLNALWSALWACLCALSLYMLLAFGIKILFDGLKLFCVGFGIVVFIAVWVVNYTDVKKFIGKH